MLISPMKYSKTIYILHLKSRVNILVFKSIFNPEQLYKKQYWNDGNLRKYINQMKIVINPSRAIEQINIIYYLILFNIIFKIKQLKRHNMIQSYSTTCLSRNELFNDDWNPFLGGGVFTILPI